MHDFEPGIKPSGLFWTIPIDASAIEADTGTGAARYAMSDVAIPDFHDFFNAISPAPTWTPGRATFDVTWEGGGERVKVRDSDFGFGGTYVGGPASISFTVADVGGGVYRSDAAGQRNPDEAPPGIGHERNGMFFDHTS